MKSKLAVSCAVLLALASGPAFAVQLGQIEIRSALNQPLVAAIPVHPQDLAELDGLTVGLASPADFARAGLTETATDRMLRFHLVTDNNGQKLILVTSSEPVTDPYLDFLVQVNTRQGKEVREFVVLLNPVIASPAPVVQAAPVGGGAASAPVAAPPVPTPAAPAQAVPELPAPPPQPVPPALRTPAPQVRAEPQPQPQPQPQPRMPAAAAAPASAAARGPQPAPAQAAAAAEARPGGEVRVKRGDTLSGIASEIAPGSGANLDQVMLALQAANPEAFYGKNINNLKAGAILRVPTRDALSGQGIAMAAAAVRRQHESWQAAKAHPATVLEGAAEEAAAKAAPVAARPATTSDHLTLAPATGNGAGTASHPGVAGGTGSGAAAGPGSSIQSRRDTLLSLDASNSELQDRVQRLENLSQKTGKLLSLKDSEVAELQQKLAAVQSGAALAARAPASGAAVKSAVSAGTRTAPPPWYMRPLAWVIGVLVILAVIVTGLLGRRDRAPAAEPARGPLLDPEDLQRGAAGSDAAGAIQPEAVAADAARASAEGGLEDEPGEAAAPATGALPDLASVESVAAASGAAVVSVVDGVDAEPPGAPPIAAAALPGADELRGVASTEPVADAPDPAATVASDGIEEAPQSATAWAAAPAGGTVAPDPSGATAAVRPAGAGPLEADPVAVEPVPVEPVPPSRAPVAEAQDYGDDPVDIKLDLARAYLDMGDQTGARAMLDEVLAQGSRVQQDVARRLLAAGAE